MCAAGSLEMDLAGWSSLDGKPLETTLTWAELCSEQTEVANVTGTRTPHPMKNNRRLSLLESVQMQSGKKRPISRVLAYTTNQELSIPGVTQMYLA